ncbi:hypothetical protein ADIARSV_1210 [Arcticibacter svalbardensis MN12-7]|uniref:PorT family protein n=1 Tax=Arcticibacter svalbardensis MN12-7 TaxID=1150600 RepID=R9H340_9SPHI|nr:hypothetical protein ADIARSV_1210 [Arcticibacter svalbardensis MN12-7]
MKNLIIISFLCFCLQTALAQSKNVHFGLKFGGNFATVTPSDLDQF